MNIEFTPNEARVIGCLIEKEITTPDQYPLSLNALTNACNQKTNREPVLELSETVVQQAVDSLMKKYMVSDKSAGYGGRVTKYRHRFCNTEFGPLKFSPQELGILCVLLLRGPQTPGLDGDAVAAADPARGDGRDAAPRGRGAEKLTALVRERGGLLGDAVAIAHPLGERLCVGAVRRARIRLTRGDPLLHDRHELRSQIRRVVV